MSRCSWCCRFEWLTGLFGRNVCAGLWSGWHGCVIRWNTWRECKQINRQTILSEHQLHVVSLTEWKRWTSFEWNELHTDYQSRNHSVLPHTHTHTHTLPITIPTHFSLIHIRPHRFAWNTRHSSSTWQFKHNVQPHRHKRSASVHRSVLHNHTPAHACTHTITHVAKRCGWMEHSSTYNSYNVSCQYTPQCSPTLSPHTHAHTHTPAHTHSQTHSTTIKQ